MRVVVPFVPGLIRDETFRHLCEYAPRFELVNVAASDYAYWQLYRELWASGDDFLVVEHDIAIHGAVIPALNECAGEWCAYSYPYAIAGTYHGAGCVRYRASLTVRFPDLINQAGRMSNTTHPPRHWCSLDAFRAHLLADAGVTMCRHEPPVRHLDTSVSHGCHHPAA